VLPSRNPMRTIFPVCCASADEQSAKSMAQSARRMMFFLLSFLPFLTLCALPGALCDFSPNHLPRPRQHVERKRRTDPSTGFAVRRDRDTNPTGQVYQQALGGEGGNGAAAHRLPWPDPHRRCARFGCDRPTWPATPVRPRPKRL